MSASTYSSEEIDHLYALGRSLLRQGDFARAEVIFRGLTEVAPAFGLSWVGLAYLQLLRKEFDSARRSTEQALRLAPDEPAVLLVAAIAHLNGGDRAQAGALLGEFGDRVSAGTVADPDLHRLYKMQLARYEG